jgi:hypothetical protein
VKAVIALACPQPLEISDMKVQVSEVTGTAAC